MKAPMHLNTIGISVFAVNPFVRAGETFFVMSGFPYISSFLPFEGPLATIMLPAAMVASAKDQCALVLLAPGDMVRLDVEGDMDSTGFLEVTRFHKLEVKPASKG